MVLNLPLIISFMLPLHCQNPFLNFSLLCCVPEFLRDCVLHPIIKPGKDPSDSDSYRPTALAPTLSTIFERCILIDHSFAFATSPSQFGFKRGLSTQLCTGLLKNVITCQNINGSPIYGCFFRHKQGL